MRVIELCEPIFWICLGGIVFGISYGNNQPLPGYRFGAWGWPAAVAGLIFLLGFCQLFAVWRSRTTKPVEETTETTQQITVSPPLTFGQKTTRIIVFLIPLGYVFLMDKMGFLLITPFFMAFNMYLLGLRSWRKMVTYTLGFYFIVVLTFVKLILTPLPPGVSFFYKLNQQLVSLIHF
ncbi:MAG: tripartite tricarboxylate transporter TctB family protein [Candidatus Methanomethylicus sp.]|nr:tripartite tricarboxylate transporter TctB family protein [Candidatus Methanomethylicus sp.]